MQISQRRVNPQLKKDFAEILYKVVADLNRPEEVELFFKSFLSKSELEIITRRIGIIFLLHRKKSYTYIKDNLAVSSATVAGIAHQMKNSAKNGLKVALDKIEAEQWADKWVKKIGSVMKFGRE